MNREIVFGSIAKRTMKAQIPDDIFVLYSHFDLDGENYRVFPKAAPGIHEPLLVASEPSIQKSAGRDLAEEAVLHLQDSSLPGTPTKAAITPYCETPHAGNERHGDETRSEVVNRRSSWAALNNLRRHVATPATPDPTRLSKTLAASSFSIHGVAGGVGETTIAAVLARLLARSGRRVGIFDEKEFSTLPIFFGGQRMGGDHRRLAGLYSMFQPDIRLLNRELFEPALPTTASNSTFIERNIAHFAHQFDHLIFDQSGPYIEGPGAGVSVYVAIPDVSSILGTKKLKGSLDMNTKVVCALNRFDFAMPLHREVLGWYQENFPEVITINSCPLVPEALAEGLTVVDWAPSSEASIDLVNLYNALVRALSRNGLAALNTLDPADFGSERLPLCC